MDVEFSNEDAMSRTKIKIDAEIAAICGRYKEYTATVAYVGGKIRMT